MAKRRTFTPEFKTKVVLEVLSGVKTQAEVCREHQLKPQVVARWKAKFLDNAPGIFEQAGHRSEEQERIAELERLIGRLTLELEAAKKASNILHAHLNRNER